jgi:phage baseplate assembly protein W
VPDIPHFTLPFQWARDVRGGLRVSTVEQESIAEVASCCECIVRTVQGERTSMPEFGRPELEFASPQFSQAAVASALVAFEPRVEAMVSAEADDSDPEIQLVRTLIAPRDTAEGEAR